jgi:predicted O-methyltransferase YrrM
MPGVMVPAAVTLGPYRRALIPPYVDYCNTVSPRHMAMSLESVTYLWWLCDRVRAGRVCDLGSGFTSYTLRAYAALADWPVEVVSVDDSPEWLERTRTFLTAAGVADDALVTWDVWSVDPGAPYDVIVHDLAKGDLRNASMWVAVEALAPGGMILFDDAQNNGHAAEMFKVCEASGMALADTKPWTLDAVNRFSLLGVPR